MKLWDWDVDGSLVVWQQDSSGFGFAVLETAGTSPAALGLLVQARLRLMGMIWSPLNECKK